MREVTMFVCEICEEADEDRNEMIVHEEICKERKAREEKDRLRRVAIGQLTIRQIITKCGDLPDLPIVVASEETATYNGKSPLKTDSYRGYYNELAIGLGSRSVSLSQFLSEMKRSLIRTYYGWRGGEYSMYDDTFVWLAESGETSRTIITDVKLSASGDIVLLCVRELKDEEW